MQLQICSKKRGSESSLNFYFGRERKRRNELHKPNENNNDANDANETNESNDE